MGALIELHPEAVIERLQTCSLCPQNQRGVCQRSRRSCLSHATAADCPDAMRRARVSIVITVGPGMTRYLPTSLESCVNQGAADVVIVFDQELAPPISGFTVVSGNWGNVQLARRAGIAASRGNAVLFIDADNRLTPGFVSRAADQLTAATLADARMAGVYPALDYWDATFSRTLDRLDPPEWDRLRFRAGNYIDASCLVWKHVLEISWRQTVTHDRLEDWAMWSELVSDGWTFQKGQWLTLDYRRRSDSMSVREHAKAYSQRYAVASQGVTVCVPMHRRRYWKRIWKWLEELAPETPVILYETAGDDKLFRRMRNAVANGPLSDVRIVRIPGTAGLADADRTQTEHQVQLEVGRIYNRFAQDCTTPLALILEDDILPVSGPRLLLDRLTGGLDETTVAVSGVYRSRLSPDLTAFRDGAGRSLQFVTHEELESPGDYLPIMGSGFGCLLIRSDALRAVPHAVDDSSPWYDPRFFEQLRRLGYTAKLAKRVRCFHGDESTAP